MTEPFPTHHAMVMRIRASYKRASQSQVDRGIAWYREAHEFASNLMDTASLPSIYTAAGIIAALSPRTRWENNTRDAANLCAMGADAVVTTYNANKAKALAILQGADATDVLGGPKVWAFWECISRPDFTDAVCVDMWAARAVGWYGPLTDLRYRKITAAYQRVAEQLSLAPHELQAIVWLEQREADNG